ncbi:MAG TPA: hypothetical protein VFR97_03690 [Capillimicrobium sp.]|nr:hypothetical protein [Capillimicrobium sp.]
MTTTGYLVLFVADPADDGHADALRDVARSVEGAGFFDDPAGGEERTVGTYLRVESLRDERAQALIGWVAGVSEALAARVEVQYREVVLGHLVAGQADDRLRAALGAVT